MVDLSVFSEEIVILIVILTILLIVVNYLLGVVMFNKWKKADLAVTRTYFLGVVLFLFVHATCRIFYFIHDFYFPNDQIWWEMGALLGLLSITLLIAAVEMTIFQKSKHVLTAVGIVGLILMTIQLIANASGTVLPVNLSQIVQYAVVSTLAVFMLLIYIYITIKSTGQVRKSSLIMTIGVAIFEVGQVAHTDAAVEIVGPIAIILAPVLMVVALSLLFVAVSSWYSE